MDSNIINAVCMGAAVTVIAAGVSIIEEERNRIYIPREPRINAIAQREFYIDSILNRGDRHCVEQIRMKPVGKDMATGNYAKSYADVNLEENTEGQSISIENEGEYEETSQGKGISSSSTQKRQHRKRNCMYKDDGVEKLSKLIGDVAFAIQSLSKNQLDVNALYAEVMKVEGFDEITLGDAFDHLVQNEMLAKAFMVKNANLRKIWVQNFVTQHYNRPAC